MKKPDLLRKNLILPLSLAFSLATAQLPEIGVLPTLAESSGVPTPERQKNDQSSGADESDKNNGDDLKIVHALNRLTFGPRPGDIERVRTMGVNSFVDQQLNPAGIPEAPLVVAVDQSSETRHENNEDLLRIYRSVQAEANNNSLKQAAREKQKQEEQKQAEQLKNQGQDPMAQAMLTPEMSMTAGNNSGDANTATNQPKQPKTDAPLARPMGEYLSRAKTQFVLARLTRDVDSPRQLEALMCEFWFNHFNVYQGKEFDAILLGSYDNDAIRPFALGKFKDLVRATCYHPAMLYYLDNSQNKGPGSVNENYARELMELHTLGVDGGYSQRDVIELARVLTGLTIATHMRTGGLALAANLQPIGKEGAYFDRKNHDMGEKILLGHTIVGSGAEEIEQALDILTKHPSTAHHICYQLAQYFLADDPPQSLVEKMQNKFLASDGDIRTVLHELFSSNEFWLPKYQTNKYKTPMRYAISTIRACGGHIQKSDRVSGFLTQQGQPLYGCLTPDGYKNTKAAWLDPDALLHRIEFALQVGSGKVNGLDLPPPDFRNLEATLGEDTFSDNTMDAIKSAPPRLKAAAVLGSPEMMRY